ncbi:hypothetical protein HXX01_04295 [Candidatus Nomurabacteria bacterium]|nr:hypothetical protein [Candidatus Nomurabacteria bacterium]
MSKKQYLSIIEQEIHNINKKIDMKILQGMDYAREAREHKQLLHKIRQHKRKGFLGRLLNSLNRFPQFSNI